MKINTIEEFNTHYSKYQIEMIYRYSHCYERGFYQIKYYSQGFIHHKVVQSFQDGINFADSLIFGCVVKRCE